MSQKIPPAVQRAVGQKLRSMLDTMQTQYGVTEEECLFLLLAITWGYGTSGGMTTEQLSNTAFQVWEIHEKAAAVKG